MWSICFDTSNLSSTASPLQERERDTDQSRTVMKHGRWRRIRTVRCSYRLRHMWKQAVSKNSSLETVFSFSLNSVSKWFERHGRKTVAVGKGERFCCSSNLQLPLQLYVGKHKNKASLWHSNYLKTWSIASFVKQARSPERTCVLLGCAGAENLLCLGRRRRKPAQSPKVGCARLVHNWWDRTEASQQAGQWKKKTQHKQNLFTKCPFFAQLQTCLEKHL